MFEFKFSGVGEEKVGRCLLSFPSPFPFPPLFPPSPSPTLVGPGEKVFQSTLLRLPENTQFFKYHVQFGDELIKIALFLIFLIFQQKIKNKKTSVINVMRKELMHEYTECICVVHKIDTRYVSSKFRYPRFYIKKPYMEYKLKPIEIPLTLNIFSSSHQN